MNVSGLPAAIAAVVPDAKHQLCIWHITKNIRSHLASKRGKLTVDKYFPAAYLAVTEADFLKAWNEFVDQCSTREAAYLETVFNLRHKWARAWTSEFKNFGILSTQRAESGNTCFKKCLFRSLSLEELLNHLKGWSVRLDNRHNFDAYVHRTKTPSAKVPEVAKEIKGNMSSFAWDLWSNELEAGMSSRYTVRGNSEVRRLLDSGTSEEIQVNVVTGIPSLCHA